MPPPRHHCRLTTSGLYGPVLFLWIAVALSSTGAASGGGPNDERMAACAPRSCGAGPNVSYPFWIAGAHPPYCGMRLFRITCGRDGYPVVPVLGDAYYVSNISYGHASFELKKRLPGTNRSCDAEYPTRNFTIDGTPFTVSNASTATLAFYFNCNRTRLPPPPVVPRDVEMLALAPLSCDPLPAGADSYVGYSLARRDQVRPPAACSPIVTVPITPFTHPGISGLLRDPRQILDFRINLHWVGPDCTRCQASGGRCGTNFEEAGFSFICICSDKDHDVSCDGQPTQFQKKMRLKIIGSAVGGATLFVGFVALLFVFRCCRRCSKALLKKQDSRSIEVFLEEYTSLALKRYKYSELKRMTNSFSEKLGQGGNGKVFKGKFKDGRHVAVKLLNESTSNGQEFMNEIASIGRTNHVNIVSLLGFCLEGPHSALVYEFMPNGSLEKFISNTNSDVRGLLQWEDIYKIASGIAKGLEYLHKGCTTRVVHFDIKPHNILLDEDFNPRISDFGLAKLCPTKGSIVSVNTPRGTIGYIAPEVFSRSFGVVSSKSDVYSYGMLILEMVGVRNNKYVRTISNADSVYFPQWIYEQFDGNGNLNLDGTTTNEYDHELVKTMILIGLWCIQTSPIERPSISKVVEVLDGNSTQLAMPPKPYLSSPVRSSKDIDSATML